MPVLINTKICDNSPECSGIEACPTGALFFDKKKKEIGFDESKCTDCGKCICCPVGAIYLAHDDKEFEDIKKLLDKDPRKISDLFVNRYGAHLLPDHYVIDESEIKTKVVDYPGKVVLEVITDDSIECLLKSIPVKELFVDSEYATYRKALVNNLDNMKEYDIKKYPCLLFFDNGELKGKIGGYFNISKKDELIEKIKESTIGLVG